MSGPANELRSAITFLTSLSKVVEERGKDRKEIVARAKRGDPRSADKLTAAVAEVAELRKALERLEVAMKNAAPVVDKWESQAKKDLYGLKAERSGGAGAPPDDARALRLVGQKQQAAVDQVRQRIDFVLSDLEALLTSFARSKHQRMLEPLVRSLDLDKIEKQFTRARNHLDLVEMRIPRG
jgi:hypothetical protein